MVELRNVSKHFGAVAAVDEVSARIETGEFLTLLGPSGCGKTTLLRMISGFETPTSGQVLIDGVDVTHLPPYRRNVNQVFQSYALFPHLTVGENIGFGLKMQGRPKGEIGERVRAVSELVSLGGLETRRPDQLSGGQRQRVALARALVCQPRVLLLDEPLSALDAKLRRRMQIELKQLQRKVGITFIFVTHDQEEALTLSDRIAVVHQGRIEQIGTPAGIYHAPCSAFVADFIGQTNLLPAQLVRRDGARLHLRLAGEIEVWLDDPGHFQDGAAWSVSIRPEKIHLAAHPAASPGSFEAEVVQEIFMGVTTQLSLRTPGGLELLAMVANESASQAAVHLGDRIRGTLHPQDLVLVRG
jgi:spermidine/putrescine transport system ATP-binding protein